MKFYRRDPDAALAGMIGLNLEERGAYNSIIDALYSRDGILKDDDNLLKQILGCHGNQRNSIKKRLIQKGKIWIENGFIKAKRVDATIEEAASFSTVQRQRIDKRWEIEKRAGKRPETRGKSTGNAREIDGKTVGNIENLQLNQHSADTKEHYTNTTTTTIHNYNKKESTTPKGVDDRGKRIPFESDQEIPNDYHFSAHSLGATELQIKQWWPEFVDYWSALPGQKGRKLNWIKTWKNRVREQIARETRWTTRTTTMERKRGYAQTPGNRARELARQIEELEHRKRVERSFDLG